MDINEIIFINAPEPILILKQDSDDIVVEDANPAYLSQINWPASGYRHSEVSTSRKIEISIPYALGQVIIPLVKQAIVTGQVTKINCPNPFFNHSTDLIGQITYWNVAIIPILDTYPVQRTYVHFKDVTELVETRTAINILQNQSTELFDLNPLPMWIYAVKTRRFLFVNRAARRQYGYSMKEFLAMTVLDIRPPEDYAMFGAHCDTNSAPGNSKYSPGKFRHIKKDGELISVDIYSSPITFRECAAKIVIAVNTTGQRNYLLNIVKQNEVLRSIANLQSHELKAPLVRLKGIAALIKNKLVQPEEQSLMFDELNKVATQLDNIIHQTTQLTQKMDFLTAELNDLRTKPNEIPSSDESSATGEIM